MVKYVFNVDGMMCGNCEKHAVTAVKSVYKNAKVTASHTDKIVEVTASEVDVEAVIKAIAECGYTVTSHQAIEVSKKGLFSIFKK